MILYFFVTFEIFSPNHKIVYMSPKLVLSAADELTIKERNLFSVTYKNMIAPSRTTWRIVSSIEQKGKGNEENIKLIKGYRS